MTTTNNHHLSAMMPTASMFPTTAADPYFFEKSEIPGGDASKTLFLGDLSYFCTEEDLCALFSPYGRIVTVRVRRGVSGESLMHGFVALDSAEAAQRAIAQLDGREFMGRNMRVQLSSDGQRPHAQMKDSLVQVHVSFISKVVCPVITEKALRDLFSPYGHIADVAIKKHQTAPKQQRQSGYGFVYFTETESAYRALRALKHHTVRDITLDCSISHKTETAIRQHSLSQPQSQPHSHTAVQPHNLSHTHSPHTSSHNMLLPPQPPTQRAHTTHRTLSAGSLTTPSHSLTHGFSHSHTAHTMYGTSRSHMHCVSDNDLSRHTHSLSQHSHTTHTLPPPPPRHSPRTHAHSHLSHSPHNSLGVPRSASTSHNTSYNSLTQTSLPHTHSHSLLRADSDVSIGTTHTTHTHHSRRSSLCSSHSNSGSGFYPHNTQHAHTTSAPPQLTVPPHNAHTQHLTGLDGLFSSQTHSPHTHNTHKHKHTQREMLHNEEPVSVSLSLSHSFFLTELDSLFTLSRSHSQSHTDLLHTHSFHTHSAPSHNTSECSLLSALHDAPHTLRSQHSLHRDSSWLLGERDRERLTHSRVPHKAYTHAEDDLDLDCDGPLTVDLAGILDIL